MSALIRAVIDTAALRHNLKTIRELALGARVMAVVKANAYGHGIVAVSKALAEADAFGVARLEEALALRAAGIAQPIVLLEGVFSAEQLQEAAKHDLDLVVHDPLQIELLERAGAAHRFVLWLKIDTGMNRLGFRPAEFRAALERLRKPRVAQHELRLMTHLARADERNESMTLAQIERFNAVSEPVPYARCIANSAGIFGTATVRCDWVRPGLSLYGVSPFGNRGGVDLGLRPVMSLESTVIATRAVPTGETVGYGGTWQAPRDSRVAIVAAGYGDGVPRSLPNGSPVLIDGEPAPLVGRVSMDMMAVDVSQRPNAAAGTRATVWGTGLPVEAVAARAGRSPYELLCGVSARVPREPA